MALQLEIVSEHRGIVGDDAVRVFHDKGGTIGRSLQNDWILPDPDRFISGRHATIDFKGGAYYLADTSSNGVYINGDCEPLGKGNPRRLFNGDVIRLGDFVINVAVDEGESLVIPLDEDALTGDAAFQSALFGGQTQTDVAQTAQNDSRPAKPRAPAPLAASDLATRELLDSFLAGLGIDRTELHPSVDMGEVMRNADEVLREYVEGTTQLLASRANLKNAFRLDQTTVLPRHNNPLKLSANTRDSIKQLLVGKEGEYLGPRDSVREVCSDLLFHQDAFLDAMNNAFLEFSDRFDPEELQVVFDRTLGTGLLAKLTNKYKYWGLYGDLYPILTEEGGGRFPQMYAEEFVRAYERQIAEFKRLGGADEHLKATVLLDKGHYRPMPGTVDDEVVEAD
ncbi:MAG: type VI secretion system-associated FHA domain protein TagH [Planctomycetota bacterium]|nr:type VI secretion system-associated FHA domain protein TagH [Pseudomonadota bacterium]MDA1180130.1 type VI secretion system-associated FHA domain protein TagH [Planctomycetota bacterium]